MRFIVPALVGTLALATASPAYAQEDDANGDYLNIGVGLGYGPSYDGSDDYVVFPVPLVQGRFKGVGIDPRPGGLAFDFIPDPANGVGFDLGIAGRVRMNRSRNIHDPVVESAGELDTAIELGPTAGISMPQLLNPYDSLTLSVDARWDVNGAHDGMVISPSIAYFTPLSRAVGASLTVSAEYGDDDFADYYYSVTPAQSAASGLPAYQADSGFTKAGANLILAYDLNGNLEDRGFAIFAVGGYSRMLGDAKRSPFTSIAGDADQWIGAIGIGFGF